MIGWLGCAAVVAPSERGAVASDEVPVDESSETGEGSMDDADPADAAALIDLSFPSELACGATATALVTLENTGQATWTRADGYKLGAIGDEDPLLDTSDVRVWLEDDEQVASGERWTFNVPLRAPDAPTDAWTDWQMVHEHVAWFGDSFGLSVPVTCDEANDEEADETDAPLPLPDMAWVVDEVAADHPDWLADSCQDDGGTWQFLDEVVDRLRLYDDRWGYNWKRGVVGDPSQDVVDYHYGSGDHEGSEEVYILDVIVGHCGDSPSPGYTDQTQATADAGTIGIWTGRGRF